MSSTASSAIKTSTQRLTYTAETRPDLWNALEDFSHPLNSAWPRFLDHDPSQQHFANTVLRYEEFRKFQYAIVEKDEKTLEETIVARGASIPFFWPELQIIHNLDDLPSSDVPQTLPDGGWDTIVSRGIRQLLNRKGLSTTSKPVLTADQERDLQVECQATQSPNTLSALSITVREDRRSLGLAEQLISAMKQTARKESLRLLIAPLRPTRKTEYPWTPIGDYLDWTLENKTPASPSHPTFHHLPVPFDPWLRKHIRLGGRIAKIASTSMVVQGGITDWCDWVGRGVWHNALRQARIADAKAEPADSGLCVYVPLPGGLVPLKIYVPEAVGVYIEPNVWLYHRL